MYYSKLGIIEAESGAPAPGGAVSPITYQRYSGGLVPTTGVTYADVQKEIGYSEQWAPDYTPILKAAPNGNGDVASEFVRIDVPPMVTCVPGWTGPDCRTPISPAEGGPTAVPDPGLAPGAAPLPTGVTRYTGPMLPVVSRTPGSAPAPSVTVLETLPNGEVVEVVVEEKKAGIGALLIPAVLAALAFMK